MSDVFDLNILPLFRIKGQEWPVLPGLLTLTPPRHTARGREQDRLIIHLTFSGNIPLSSSEYNQITSQMARRFYETAGSLTSAIRTVIQTLNLSLVERNLRTTGKGQYIIGRLILAVMRGSQVILAQCGPTHVFHRTEQGTSQIHDTQISGRGLGIAQATLLYLGQVVLNPNDQLLLCSDLPSGWENSLLQGHRTPVERLRADLLAATVEDVNAILLEAVPGKGSLNLQKVLPSAAAGSEKTLRQKVKSPPAAVVAGVAAPAAPATAKEPPTPAVALPTSQVESRKPASRFAQLLSGTKPAGAAPATQPAPAQPLADTAEVKTAPPVSPQTQPVPTAPKTETVVSAHAPKIQEKMAAAAPAASAPPARASAPAAAGGRERFISKTARLSGELPEIVRKDDRSKAAFRTMAGFIRGARLGSRKISSRVGTFIPNLLPAASNRSPEVGSSSLAFVAIAIPIILVTIAGLVYSHYGRSIQYQDNYNLALAQAAQAHTQSDPREVRRSWDSTLYYLDMADRYLVTDDSLDLRQQAQVALDNMDSILRLDFSPAIAGGLDQKIQISRMTATSTDLYLLDSATGSVLRAMLGSQRYEIDTSFTCAPGQYGNIAVGKLIDIEALPMSNDFNARVMGIDANGNLLYCGFNMKPVAMLLAPPALGWQKIAAFTLDADGKYLYVLDPSAGNVWTYAGTSGKFTNSPSMFFGEQVPLNMGTSIDLAANNSNLYLLFLDGHIAICASTRFQGVPLRCSDPATYVDNRPERQNGAKIADAVFSQLTFATAPDPLIYLLEPLTRAVYSFSPRSDSLELRAQFRAGLEQSSTLFNNPATAMTLSPNRYLFLSTGSQVFFAAEVP